MFVAPLPTIWNTQPQQQNQQEPEPAKEPAKVEPDPAKSVDPDQLGDAGKRALQQERDARTAAEKKAVDLEAKVKEFEDKNLTESQRLERERDDAKSELTGKSAQLARYEAAEKAELPLSWAKRLVGDTPEELEADAKSVAADLAVKGKGGTPAADKSQGKGSGSSAAGGSVAAAREEYLARRKK